MRAWRRPLSHRGLEPARLARREGQTTVFRLFPPARVGALSAPAPGRLENRGLLPIHAHSRTVDDIRSEMRNCAATLITKLIFRSYFALEET